LCFSETGESNTRHLFAQPFRKRGPVKLSTYLTNYKVGDYVDIKANASIHKGMPHKFYHGKTGIVWNVTRRAIGVRVNKRVGNRLIRKRIHVRIEHAKKSTCREDFLNRVKENEQKKSESRKNKQPLPNLKRCPGWPRPGVLVKRSKTDTIETVKPMLFEWVV